MAKAKKTAVKKNAPAKKKAAAKQTDAEKVEEYMSKLKHPMKKEMEAVRSIIKGVNREIGERIKWNAPSYYYKAQDMVTFNGWAAKNVHLVFHHPEIVNIKSKILEGDYPSRRMTYFNTSSELAEKRKELEKVMKELIKRIDSK